jgi:hypothetical protein
LSRLASPQRGLKGVIFSRSRTFLAWLWEVLVATPK